MLAALRKLKSIDLGNKGMFYQILVREMGASLYYITGLYCLATTNHRIIQHKKVRTYTGAIKYSNSIQVVY